MIEGLQECIRIANDVEMPGFGLGLYKAKEMCIRDRDISAIPAIKKLSHLPVVVDPSHASGLSYMVESLALAAVAAGADGLLIEVHNDPKHALCDGAQSLTPEAFDGIMHKINALKSIMS